MQKFSIHTHTNFTDGENTAEEMISAAQEVGLELYGISDHFIVHENVNPFLSHMMFNSFDGMVDKWEKHFENIRNVAKNYNIEVKCGLEVDYFNDDNWRKQFEDFKRQITPDYIISGSHHFYSDDLTKIYNFYEYDIDRTLDVNVDEYMRNYWNNIIEATKSGYFDMVAHFDFPKRYDFIDINKHKDKQNELIETLIKCKMPIEINVKQYSETNTYSPDIDRIKRLIDNNHPICISDDAHKVKGIADRYSIVEAELIKAGHTNFWKPDF